MTVRPSDFIGRSAIVSSPQELKTDSLAPSLITDNDNLQLFHIIAMVNLLVLIHKDVFSSGSDKDDLSIWVLLNSDTFLQ